MVKFYLIVNNDIVGILENEGVEVVMLDFLDFFFYLVMDVEFKVKYFVGSKMFKNICNLVILYMEIYRKIMKKLLEVSNRFFKLKYIRELVNMVLLIFFLGN